MTQPPLEHFNPDELKTACALIDENRVILPVTPRFWYEFSKAYPITLTRHGYRLGGLWLSDEGITDILLYWVLYAIDEYDRIHT